MLARGLEHARIWIRDNQKLAERAWIAFFAIACIFVILWNVAQSDGDNDRFSGFTASSKFTKSKPVPPPWADGWTKSHRRVLRAFEAACIGYAREFEQVPPGTVLCGFTAMSRGYPLRMICRPGTPAHPEEMMVLVNPEISERVRPGTERGVSVSSLCASGDPGTPFLGSLEISVTYTPLKWMFDDNNSRLTAHKTAVFNVLEAPCIESLLKEFDEWPCASSDKSVPHILSLRDD